MRKQDIDRGLAAAYPVSREGIVDLALGEADRELVAAIVAEPQDPPARRGIGVLRRDRLIVAVAAAAACGLLVAAIGIGGGGGGAPAPGYASDLDRLAKISPHILLGGRGWHPVLLNARKVTAGYIAFKRGMGLPRSPQQVAMLSWHAKDLNDATRALTSQGAVPAGTAPVLGATAQVYTFATSVEDEIEGVALWTQSDRAFEFRISVPDLATFEGRLASLREASEADWLDAMAPFAAYLRGLAPQSKRTKEWLVTRTPSALRAEQPPVAHLSDR